jgi:hypothetical protein
MFFMSPYPQSAKWPILNGHWKTLPAEQAKQSWQHLPEATSAPKNATGGQATDAKMQNLPIEGA